MDVLYDDGEKEKRIGKDMVRGVGGSGMDSDDSDEEEEDEDVELEEGMAVEARSMARRAAPPAPHRALAVCLSFVLLATPANCRAHALLVAGSEARTSGLAARSPGCGETGAATSSMKMATASGGWRVS